ncbi:MAG TPA: hypothetical protein VHR45_13650 [Thermoanaerobaculia bacterium]|nr:hypothetical protein [Thermoanaerobaculia bacterium]
MCAPVEDMWAEILAFQARAEPEEQIDDCSIMRWEDDGGAIYSRHDREGGGDEEDEARRR